MEKRQKTYKSIVHTNNDSVNSSILSSEGSLATAQKVDTTARSTTSNGSASRPKLSSKPSMTTSPDRVIRQKFKELFNEPISEQHQSYFRKYFRTDISVETFTVDEFGLMLQVKSMLSILRLNFIRSSINVFRIGRRLLSVFGLDRACETNLVFGADMMRIAHVLQKSSVPVKALILFKLFDSDGNDMITIKEIREFYRNYSSKLEIFRNQEHQKEVVDVFLQSFFPVNDDGIQQQELSFSQFYETLQRNPAALKCLYRISIPDHDKEEEKEITWYQHYSTYIKNNANRLLFITIYILSQISLITYVCVYRIAVVKDTSVWRIIARIGGMLINFNYAVAISLMLKQIMTIIRRIRHLRLIIPVDDHIAAHRLVGTLLFLSAVVHSLGHALHFATHTNKHSSPESMPTRTTEIDWVNHPAPITGYILFALLMIMFICSLQCIRQRSGLYQLFQYSHYLFWPISILLIIHSPDFWKWVIGPLSLLCLEKVYLLKSYSLKHGRTRLKSVRIEDDNVLTLIMERPTHFKFRVGNYINICFPKIVRMEWHPFTISSAPGRKDIIRINIMKKRNWTKKVYDHFYTRVKSPDDPYDLTEITIDSGNSHGNSNSSNISLPKDMTFSPDDEDATVWIEGPFSSCTAYVFDCEHVVLIGAGIGITPSMSALDSLIHRLQEQRCVCPNCRTIIYNHAKLPYKKLKKVDFVWINREVGNFSWFRDILGEFENEQETYLNTLSSSANNAQEHPSRYLDMHLYCTSLRRDEQAMLEHLPYDLVANTYAAVQQRDMHTQLRTPTHVGRPPWKLLFSKFKAEHQSTNVFLTGNAAMADEIKRYCDEFGFFFRHEPGF